MNLVEENLLKIIELCKKYRVGTLSVFDSILTYWFNDNRDVDFLVNFHPNYPENIEFDCLTNNLDLADTLE